MTRTDINTIKTINKKSMTVLNAIVNKIAWIK